MHSWQKDPNPLIYKDPPILPTPPQKKKHFFFNVCPPNHFIDSSGGWRSLLFLLPCFFGWMSDCAILYVILLTDIMDLHLLSLNSSVTKGPWHVIYATRHQVYWGLTHNVVFCWYSALISHTQKHIHTKGHNTLRDQ